MDSSTVSLVSQFNKPYVKFTVDVVTPTSGHSENAFNRLMAGSRRLFQMERQNRKPQLRIPAMKSSSSPGYGFTQKDALQNHIIEDLLERNDLHFKDKHQVYGWSADVEC